MSTRSGNFVSTIWLASHLQDVVVVDGSWHLPGSNRDAAREYAEHHIPGAVFFDIDAIADISSPLPHMLPSPNEFASAVGALGIDAEQQIVVYDSTGLSSAPRVWWSFKVMGAKDVTILEGGLPRWMEENRPLETGAVIKSPKVFRATLNGSSVKDLAGVREGVTSGQLQLVDARPAPRFRGEMPEPRKGVRSGHIPGSYSLPSTELVNNGQLKSSDDLRTAFAKAGVDIDEPIVTSCGSGVNAAILTLALEEMGVSYKRSALYDGSWTEWGMRDDTPVITGE